MRKRKTMRGFNRNRCADNEYRCDNIFRTFDKQPYLETTQGGKWGRGKDDSPVDKDEYPPDNNPLPY